MKYAVDKDKGGEPKAPTLKEHLDEYRKIACDLKEKKSELRKKIREVFYRGGRISGGCDENGTRYSDYNFTSEQQECLFHIIENVGFSSVLFSLFEIYSWSDSIGMTIPCDHDEVVFTTEDSEEYTADELGSFIPDLDGATQSRISVIIKNNKTILVELKNRYPHKDIKLFEVAPQFIDDPNRKIWVKFRY